MSCHLSHHDISLQCAVAILDLENGVMKNSYKASTVVVVTSFIKPLSFIPLEQHPLHPLEMFNLWDFLARIGRIIRRSILREHNGDVPQGMVIELSHAVTMRCVHPYSSYMDVPFYVT